MKKKNSTTTTTKQTKQTHKNKRHRLLWCSQCGVIFHVRLCSIPSLWKVLHYFSLLQKPRDNKFFFYWNTQQEHLPQRIQVREPYIDHKWQKCSDCHVRSWSWPNPQSYVNDISSMGWGLEKTTVNEMLLQWDRNLHTCLFSTYLYQMCGQCPEGIGGMELNFYFQYWEVAWHILPVPTPYQTNDFLPLHTKEQ